MPILANAHGHLQMIATNHEENEKKSLFTLRQTDSISEYDSIMISNIVTPKQEISFQKPVWVMWPLNMAWVRYPWHLLVGVLYSLKIIDPADLVE